MYAVISLQGHQYIVTEGDTIIVDKIDAENGSEIEVKEVLSIFDENGDKALVGAPYLKAHVVCKVVEAKQ
ncbi:TPA: 50S ribosomal protein L21 [Patescibacteria group bacterium]|nr:50S ribosomal protein L21 [Candidatus Gracilibacteria bacterium]